MAGIEPLEDRWLLATLMLHPSKDNTLYQSPTGALSNGLGDFLFAGTTATGGVRRAVLAFDLASAAIPPGSSVTDVSLELLVSRSEVAGDEQIALHQLQKDWGEGTSNAQGQEGGGAAATAGDATWLHNFFSTTTWDSEGGDFEAQPSAITTVRGTGTIATWSSPAMVADVQAWLNSPAANFGWIVLADEAAIGTAKQFHSKDRSGGTRPKLTITFSEPGQSLTLQISGDDLVVQDTRGDVDNRLTLSLNGSTTTIRDANSVITTSIAGAAGSGTNAVTVPLSAFSGEVVFDTQGGNDTLILDDSVSAALAGRVSFQGGPGDDSFQLAGGGIALDLSQFRDVDRIDFAGSGNNTLRAELASALSNVDDASDSLALISNAGDTLTFDSGWSLADPIVAEDTFFRVVQQAGATLRVSGPLDWQNPLEPMDVNANQAVVPFDVLFIINELNNPQVITALGRLFAAATVVPFPGFYYDVDGNGFLTSFDALVIINFFATRPPGEGESSQVFTDNGDPSGVAPRSGSPMAAGTLGRAELASALLTSFEIEADRPARDASVNDRSASTGPASLTAGNRQNRWSRSAETRVSRDHGTPAAAQSARLASSETLGDTFAEGDLNLDIAVWDRALVDLLRESWRTF